MAQKRILIVDDEKLVRWALCQKCAEFGFQTLEAESGEQAIRTLQNDSVDAVLLDVHLPDLSGIEVLDKLKQAGETRSIIMMTADPQLDDVKAALRLGAYDFVSKPINFDELSVTLQNAFAAVPLLRSDGNGLSSDFQRYNHFYLETLSATFRPLPEWDLGLGYSYQQNNLATYMAFQNDSTVNYVVNEPLVPYKQITQAYWAESSYLARQRFGLNFRITYNSSRSGFRPDLNPNDAAVLGNANLIAQSVFDPVMFAAALNNLQFSSTQISQVIVPQWIGQGKAYYLFPRKFEGGLVMYYGSYRDYWNPNLNGVLRTFNIYVGRSW